MIAALFVAEGGPYFGIEGVDPWPEKRDARRYAGPWPVVAHPPCERWGRYATGGPNPMARRRKLGDDGGCFEAALAAVRLHGGVLEHPAYSRAFPTFGIVAPPLEGGWVAAGDFVGWVCHVEQGNYGHAARKATWLYAVAEDLPSLRWGPSAARKRADEGFHSKEERARARCRNQAQEAIIETRTRMDADAVSRSARSHRRLLAQGYRACEFLSRRQRAMTPPAFRDVLLAIARGASSQLS